MRPLSKYMAAVHAHCLASGRAMTSDDVLSLFGLPPTTATVPSLMASAAENGWFRKEKVEVEGLRHRVVEIRYHAVSRAAEQAKPPDTRKSWFTGIKRVNSVFQLGENP